MDDGVARRPSLDYGAERCDATGQDDQVDDTAGPRVGVRPRLQGGGDAAETRDGVAALRVAEATVGEVAERDAQRATHPHRHVAPRSEAASSRRARTASCRRHVRSTRTVRAAPMTAHMPSRVSSDATRKSQRMPAGKSPSSSTFGNARAATTTMTAYVAAPAATPGTPLHRRTAARATATAASTASTEAARNPK